MCGDPRWRYEHGASYGYCTVLEVRTGKPLILEFKAPEPGTPLEPPVTLVLQEHEFVTHRYVENHLKPPSTHVVSGRPKGRKSKAGTLGPAWMVAALAAPALPIRQAARSRAHR